ncbi:hypothetical protein BLL42_11350 [Pseudomonas frederiksbergensis]|uniref:Mu-like prophage FluMu N-terminal domain-containing protein n=1 Tax=Pseudomonas frederiksbergensis TaxID=104087 RepID=A0A1J0EJT1_9PSED|nr:HI1506-related protein [Pseudomonas frederiksbergensis]APC16294.1 hypothetical protein BLL42_11350 [Pseudomonas frederiksbergensis]
MAFVITAKRDGFRRCGIAHPGKPTSYPDDFFTEEQLRALDKEPQLILAYAEDEFDQVQERFNESLSQTALPQAPNTLEAGQPQTLETNAAPLANAVVSAVSEVLGNSESGPDARGPGPVSVMDKVEDSTIDGGQDTPPPGDQPDGSPAADATDTAAKPEKAQATKAKAAAK